MSNSRFDVTMATVWPPINVAFSIFGVEPQSVQNITLSDEKLGLDKFHTLCRTCFQAYIECVHLAVSKLWLATRINKIVRKFFLNLIFMFTSHLINMWTIVAVMNANIKAVAVTIQCSTNWANKPTFEVVISMVRNQPVRISSRQYFSFFCIHAHVYLFYLLNYWKIKEYFLFGHTQLFQNHICTQSQVKHDLKAHVLWSTRAKEVIIVLRKYII